MEGEEETTKNAKDAKMGKAHERFGGLDFIFVWFCAVIKIAEFVRCGEIDPQPALC